MDSKRYNKQDDKHFPTDIFYPDCDIPDSNIMIANLSIDAS